MFLVVASLVAKNRIPLFRAMLSGHFGREMIGDVFVAVLVLRPAGIVHDEAHRHPGVKVLVGDAVPLIEMPSSSRTTAETKGTGTPG